MEPNLIKDISDRYKNRKKAKQNFDRVYTLSAKEKKPDAPYITLSAKASGQTVRLLDEGMVVASDGSPLFYIMKGALKAFYDGLPEDYIGTVNIGHLEFASFPFLVGEWSKKDISLVDIGDGRQGLDVKLHLDGNSIFVKELRRLSYPVGVSAEFFYAVDYEASEAMRIEAIASVNIKDFAIVGEAGSVSSGGINLKGESNEMNPFEKLIAKYLKGETGEPEKKEEGTAGPKGPEGKPGVPPEMPKGDAGAEGEAAALAAVEGILQEREEARNLAVTLGDKLGAAEEELAKLKRQLAAKSATGESVVGKIAALAAKYGVEQQEKHMGTDEPKPNNTLSDDGWGVL